MKIIGANLEKTKKGMLLNDGGLCLIDNQDITILSEERFTRKKYSGGFENSLNELLKRKKLSISDIDLFVFSSCCELPEFDLKLDYIPKEKICIIPSHHLSHAYSTYFSSGFNEALIIVMDNEGNIVNDLGKDKFYENDLEHMTYYIAKGKKVELYSREKVNPKNIGVCDAYRYFTHYLGFPSYVYAGKTMGLAPYGNPEKYKDVDIFDFDENTGDITCKIKNNYENCCKSIKEFFEENYNKEVIEPRTPIDDITQDYADLAYLIQNQVEKILIKKINYLIKKTGIKNVCISGGIGLNSVANGKILNQTDVEKLFVLPASGDTGQCLGNAYYGYYDVLNNNEIIKFKSPYLGFEYSNEEILSELKKFDNISYTRYSNISDLNLQVAKYLVNNEIIARFYGKSEFGPRALGNRSILMNPMYKENKDILNKRVKFRESFRPFAPSVLIEYASELFDINVESPYMLLVANVKKPELIPAVTHVDNSARLQTVSKSENESYYDLIEKFYKLTNVPVLLNTSFNINGEPIVETPYDAIRCFTSTNIDKLIIGNFLVEKM